MDNRQNPGLTHPHLGRPRIGPVIVGAAPMQHRPRPFPDGPNDSENDENINNGNENGNDDTNTTHAPNTSESQNKDKSVALPDDGTENLDMPGGQAHNSGTCETGTSSRPADTSSIAVLSDAGKGDLDMTGGQAHDSGIHGTGRSSTSTENQRISEAAPHVFFPHVGLDRTRPHNSFQGISAVAGGPSNQNSQIASDLVGESNKPTGTSYGSTFLKIIGSLWKNVTKSLDTTTSAARTIKATSTKAHLDTADVLSTKSALAKKIPPELIDPVLDYAHYFPSAIIGERSTEASVTNQRQLYLTATIPDFPAFDSTTEGRGGVESQGRPNRVRKLVFNIKSRDQGWSSFPADHGTYSGSYSWIEVELWRRESKSSSDNTSSDDNHNNNDNDNNAQGGEYKQIGEPEIVQRNKHACRQFLEHEVVWSWDTEDPADEEGECWEPDRPGWWKNGHHQNPKFVRKLRGGDKLKVYIASRFGGWVCRAASCSIRVFWAI